MFQKLKVETGSMMIISVMLMVVLGVFGITIGKIAINNSQMSSQNAREVEAYHIAEGALDYYLKEAVEEIYDKMRSGDSKFYLDDFIYGSNSNDPYQDADGLEKYFADDFFPSNGQGVAEKYLNKLDYSNDWDIEVANFEYTWEAGSEGWQDASISFEVRVFEEGSNNPIKVIRRQTGIDAHAIALFSSSSVTGGDIEFSGGTSENDLEINGRTQRNVDEDFFDDLFNFDRYKERAKDLNQHHEKWQGTLKTGISTKPRQIHYLGQGTDYIELGENYGKRKNKSHQYPTILFVDGDLTIKGKDGLHLNNHYIIAKGEVTIESADTSDGSTKNQWNWPRDEEGNIDEDEITEDRLPNYNPEQYEKENPGEHLNKQQENFTKNDGKANNSFIYGESGINIEGNRVKTSQSLEEPQGDNIISKDKKTNLWGREYWEYEYNTSSFDNSGMMMTPEDIKYSNGENSQNKLDYSNIDLGFLLGFAPDRTKPIDDYVEEWEEIK